MNTRTKRAAWIALAAAPALVLVGCTGGGGGGGSAPDADGNITLSLAHSYSDDQPQAACGAQVIADEVAAADVGVTIEVFGSSALGGDADRIASVASGDIDIDIQGASALGAVYEPISVMDAAYAFDDAAHLADFVASDASGVLFDNFEQTSGVHTLGVWSSGARQFTSNAPVRTPADLDGQRMRFPGSPQFLMNAEAMGAQATEVAYEELYLALQQGTADGQENPITNIKSLNLQEVQDYLSLSAHQLSTNLIIIGPAWNNLDADQQKALEDAVTVAVDNVTQCVADEEEATLDEWRSGGQWQIVDDVDRDAFSQQAEAYFTKNLSGDSLTVFEAIRSTSN